MFHRAHTDTLTHHVRQYDKYTRVSLLVEDANDVVVAGPAKAGRELEVDC